MRGLGKLPQIQPRKSSADRRAKEVAKPLPLLLSPASTPPVRRPRQRPSQISGRGAPSSPQSLILRHPPRARMFFCFSSRAQRCRGLLTGGEEAGDRRRPEEASPPTSPTSDLQRGVWGNFPRYNPRNLSRQAGKGSREAPPFAPASTPPVKRPRQRPSPISGRGACRPVSPRAEDRSNGIQDVARAHPLSEQRSARDLSSRADRRPTFIVITARP